MIHKCLSVPVSTNYESKLIKIVRAYDASLGCENGITEFVKPTTILHEPFIRSLKSMQNIS
jgi:hypothetical protein